MNTKPRNIYEVSATFVDLTDDAQAATIDLVTTTDIDLSLHLHRETLERLRSQIAHAMAILALRTRSRPGEQEAPDE